MNLMCKLIGRSISQLCLLLDISDCVSDVVGLLADITVRLKYNQPFNSFSSLNVTVAFHMSAPALANAHATLAAVYRVLFSSPNDVL